MTDFGAWPHCAVPGCLNKVCLRLNSNYCWDHTPGLMTEEVDESLRAQAETQEAESAPHDNSAVSR
jgi:hypothetical protein